MAQPPRKADSMKLAIAIVVAALIIAVALIISNRYSIETDSQHQVVWRVDHLTGDLVVCGVGSNGKTDCLRMPRPRNSN